MNKIIQETLYLNKKIKENKLVKLTWGNASVLSDDGKYIAIKPSGINFKELNFSDISILNLYTEEHISGKKPSVDTPIHLEIYRAFQKLNLLFILTQNLQLHGQS